MKALNGNERMTDEKRRAGSDLRKKEKEKYDHKEK